MQKELQVVLQYKKKTQMIITYSNLLATVMLFSVQFAVKIRLIALFKLLTLLKRAIFAAAWSAAVNGN